jgi:osmotically-inducible protein OsmY
MQDRNHQPNRPGQKNRAWGNSQAQPYSSQYRPEQYNQFNNQIGYQPYGQYLGTDREANGPASRRLRQDAEAAFGDGPSDHFSRNQNYDANTYSNNNSGSGSYEDFAESDYGSGSMFGSGSGYAGGRYENTDTQWRSVRPAPREDRYSRDLGGHTRTDSVSDRFVSHQGKGPKGYQRSDSRIQEEVSDALMADHYIDASDVEVAVKDGIVTLSGKVSERRMKRMAEDCAEGIRGVKDVRNEISTNGIFSALFGDKNKLEATKSEPKKLM